jgi:4'-phosphopantetheinyl transferase
MRIAWAPVPAGTPRRAVAWDLVRELIPGARLTNPCPRCGGAHGAVRVHGADAVASVSYAGGLAVVAVASGAEAIGVDAERSDREPGVGRVLRPGATVRDWVRVEAVLKADGRGVRVDPSLVDIRFSADARTARVADRDVEYEVTDVGGPPGVVVSVARRRSPLP